MIFPTIYPGSRALRRALGGLLILLGLSGVLAAQSLESFSEKVKVHVLQNGWTFIIMERPVAPVFSFSTIVDVGGAQEVPGITGLAHMFEHMAFKGTPNIGTKDYEAEKKALAALEESYLAYQSERLNPTNDDSALERLRTVFEQRQKEAAEFVVQNEFGDIISKEGGVGLNAGTNNDSTIYFYSLPANKFELFCFLESERFLRPVYREYYKERDVVQEERRLRTESQPIGRMIEQLLMGAFTSHPYHQPVVGYMSDLESITITDAEAFFKKYYVPSNMVTSIVGDVKTDEVVRIIERYFGRIPAGPKPEPLRTIEPEQIVERLITLQDPSQPIYAEAYHKPAQTHPDQPVYDVIDDILSQGRTSRLYRSLVRDKKIAVNAFSFSPFPGGKYPNLWIVLAIPSRGETNETVAAALHEEIDLISTELVSDSDLAKAKTRARANLIRSLGSNQGLANQLSSYQTSFGDWRELFRHIDRLQQVTKEDVRRVASETFKASNRTVAMIETEPGDSASGR